MPSVVRMHGSVDDQVRIAGGAGIRTHALAQQVQDAAGRIQGLRNSCALHHCRLSDMIELVPKRQAPAPTTEAHHAVQEKTRPQDV